MVLDLRMGDVLRMRRKHPCGGLEWDVVRVGADIGLRCRTCGRRVLMERPVLARRAKELVERGPPVDSAIEQALFGQPFEAPAEDEEQP
ncbi:MAG: DUF951 family protein [Dehalococcoidia bacterium]|nr:DUF951 family protein [Dehalococcoidia bacterium]